MNTKFSSIYVPTQNLTLDESMVAYRGRVGFVHYIPSKPTKFGIKIHCICESNSGYCIRMKLDGGKKERKLPHYTQFLAKELLVGMENKGYVLFSDSWYSSIKLFEELSLLGIAATGMIRADRAKIIQKLITTLCDDDNKIANRNRVNAIIYKDKFKQPRKKQTSKKKVTNKGILRSKPVVLKMISTIHTNNLEETKTKRGKTHKVPNAVVQYRNFMKGVDLMDQEIQCYKFPHKSLKWWLPIFYHLLEISLNNSRIWYNKHENKKMSPLDFRLEIVEGLLTFWSSKIPKKRSYIQITNPSLNPLLPAINILNIHDIIKIAHFRGYCVMCSNKQHEIRTCYKCLQCQIAICPTCFKSYHNLYVYK